MATTKVKTITTLALTAALALVAAGCGDGADTAAAGGKDVRCETMQTQLTTVPQMVTATGSLEAATTILVSTRMMGWVRAVHVEAGQTVAAGDPLVTIDDTDLMAKRAQAEAGIVEAEAVLTNAERMVGRFERLYEEKSVSKAQLEEVTTGRDRAAAGLTMAEAGLREVDVHLSYVKIVAPVDGLVARRMIDAGDMANPGMPMVILEQSAQVKVVAHVGEKDISLLTAGTPLTVDVSSVPGAVFETTIARVVPAANPGSRTYDVEAYLDNADGRLRSGMFARVSVSVGSREAVLVPASSLTQRGQLTGVWLVDAEGRARLRWVRPGKTWGDQMEILSGLEGSETVVTSAAVPLVEGDRVVN